MARWLVVGAAGMLGTDLVAVLRGRGHEVVGADLPDIDVLDPASCAAAVRGHDVVVNCAAYTAVDAAEDDEARAFAVNAVGAAHLARAVAAEGSALVHISTDYVVAGDGSRPYAADAPVAPASAYGRTKAAGEWAVRAECPRTWVVRTAWLYGAHGRSIPATVARLARERETFGFVADQVGQPTWTVDLAEGIARVVEAGAPYGTWHGTNGGETSWHGLAQAVLEELGLDPARVSPIATADYPLPAPRPSYSVLAHDMWAEHGLEPLPHWRDALHRAAPALFPDAAAHP
ncbi:dTDP-4-dehydrorhamnose reductase [Phycicoccus sp. CSK15P-2]|uniref:dTDP-4-dehydrorhamnose reductase n=1 Tax=Phycicoccus sp. CSK15P-2 TaxID=2807627 RepID=UPI0019515BFC|nr:dTDP-4-dehydrorhamnose reductase [Phycicoccus sp. CSK15P-2]MBM6405255.1 dTDP-4-dehydrorhamnose reductase [Phycicoccus sp. CSK15P-2]